MFFPVSDFSIENARSRLIPAGTAPDRRAVVEKLLDAARRMGPDAFREKAARALVQALRPGDILPEAYADYRAIVSDGIEFLFARLALPRAAALAAEQILLDPDTPARERLVALARSVPTLQKLGQIIARNRNLEPALRSLLSTLESSAGGEDPEAVRDRVHREIANYLVPYQIRTERTLLFEASVGAVIGFSWTAPNNGQSGKGVFKVLKPGVRTHLAEEFRILDGLAEYFEERRDRYPLRSFRFRETFADVRTALEEEIRLRGEQDHLRRADRFYAADERVRVPSLLPFCTDNVTAMERMPGGKLLDLSLDAGERRDAAWALFRALIWRPLFSLAEKTPFHGDPHAGNLYAFRGARNEVLPVLLDWSLSDTLARTQRMGMIRLVMNVLLGDSAAVTETLSGLSVHTKRAEVERIVGEVLAAPRPGRAGKAAGHLARAFDVIDRAAVAGIRFPAELLLFRKAFFTLDGVLHDLDPDFHMDAAAAELAADAFLREMPRRWYAGMFPRLDRPDHFATLLSNRDLAWFAGRLMLEAGDRGGRYLARLSADQAELFRRAACLALPPAC
jgi:ubiquinone biosynthesis protein